MVGRLVSFWNGPFSGAMLVLGRVVKLDPDSFGQVRVNIKVAFETTAEKNLFHSSKKKQRKI